MSSAPGGEEPSVAYVLPAASADIRFAQPSGAASLSPRRCSRVRRPRSALRSNWVDGGGDGICRCSLGPRDRAEVAGLALPVYCSNGSSPEPKDSSENGNVKTDEREGKNDSWFSGLKVWFRPKGVEEEDRGLLGDENDKLVRESAKELPERTGTAAEECVSSASSEGSGSVKDQRASSRGSFQWPWQKDSNTTGIAKGKGTEGDGLQAGAENPNAPSKKKVTHTDSKPGGSFTASSEGKLAEGTGKSKKRSSLQDTWDKVVEAIAPNLPNFGDSKKKGKKANVADKEVSSKSSSNGTHGNFDDKDSSALPRSSTVRELYSPPSENDAEGKSEPSSRQARTSKWPRFPWDRDDSAAKEDREETEVVSNAKRSSGPRISTVDPVKTPEKESVEQSSLPASSVRRDGEQKRGGPTSNTKGISQSTLADKDDVDRETTDAQGEDQRQNEPALQLPTVRSSQLKMSHVDMASIPQRDVAAIRLIFGSETFFATETLSPPGGLIFRGNLRGEPKATVAKLEERLASRLGDKYTLCLAEGEEDLRPVVVIVPTARDKRPATPRQRFFAVVIGLLTITTCLARGLYAISFKPLIESFYPVTGASVVEKFFSIPSAVSFTTAASICVIILISQIVQRVVASRYRTRITLPYFIPSFQLGSFGAVVQLASPTPTRDALFDIALSGAATLVFISLSLLLVGLRLSTTFSGVVPVPISTVSSSVVLGFLTQNVPHGNILVDYGRSLIALHPLAVIGANCLTIAALNLLPMRQLDGGRIISALYGRRTAVFASRVTVMFLLLASTKSPYFVVFLAAVTFGPWNMDRPSKNELTEPGSGRTIVGYLFMLLMIGVLLPYPASKFFGTL